MQEMKLWRRVVSGGVDIGPREGIENVAVEQERLRNEIATAELIYHRSAFGHLSEEGEIESCAIPFPMFFFEGVENDPMSGEPFRFGALVKSTQEKDGVAVHFDVIVDATRKAYCSASIAIKLDANGTETGEPSISAPFLAEASGKKVALLSLLYSHYVMCALSYLSCKNVSLEPRAIDQSDCRRAKKYFGPKAGGFRYHVLIVKPPGAKSSSIGQEIGMMPYHKVRGHFRRYGDQFGRGLLFGRLSGKFFIPPHMQGDKANGTISKDYLIS